MALTRAFKSGNSQAVRIPAELAYDDPGIELTVTRLGDVIVIAPARPTIKEAIAKLRAAPKSSSSQVRDPVEMPDRAWD